MTSSSSYMKLSFAIPHQHVGAALALLADWGATGLEFHNVEIKDRRGLTRAKAHGREPAAVGTILSWLSKAPALRVELLSHCKAAGLKPHHLNVALRYLLHNKKIKRHGKKFSLPKETANG